MSIIARVYDYEITGEELKYAMSLVSKYNCGCTEVPQQALEYLIDRCLLLREAKAINVRVSDDEWNDKIYDVASRFETVEEYNEYIESHYLTRNRYEEAIHENLIIKKYLDGFNEFTKREVSDGMSEFVTTHSELFACCTQARVYNILVSGEEAGSLEKISSLSNEIKSLKDFEKAAENFSDCPSNAECGDMGYVTPNILIKELDDVIFSMNMNEVSKPIKTKFGYHLLYVTERKKINNLTDNEKNDFMFSCFVDGKSQMYVHQYMNELNVKAKKAGELEIFI